MWLNSTPLSEFALPGFIFNCDDLVCDFWNDTGWNTDLLASCLPLDITEQILNVPPAFDSCGEDSQIWGYTSNGTFRLLVLSLHIVFSLTLIALIILLGSLSGNWTFLLTLIPLFGFFVMESCLLMFRESKGTLLLMTLALYVIKLRNLFLISSEIVPLFSLFGRLSPFLHL